MTTDAKVALGIVFLLLIYGLVGRMDYVDALEQENEMLKHKSAACVATRPSNVKREVRT